MPSIRNATTSSARVRTFVDFLAAHFAKASTRAAGMVSGW